MQQKFWQRIRFIRWLLCLAMVGTVAAFFVGIKIRPAERLLPAVIAKATSGDAEVSLNNFDYRDVREGNALWLLKAATARYFDQRQETVLSKVNAVFHLKDGSKVELQGDEGVLHNDNNNIEVSGNVRLSYGDDYTLLTDQLRYDRAKELIHTPAPVFAEGQGITLRGLGMRLEIGTHRLSILSNIETTMQGIISFQGRRQSMS